MLKIPIRDRRTAKELGVQFEQLRSSSHQHQQQGRHHQAAPTSYFFTGGPKPALHESLPGGDAQPGARRLPVHIVGSMHDEARRVMRANRASLRLPVHDNLVEETIEGLSSLRAGEDDVI